METVKISNFLFAEDVNYGEGGNQMGEQEAYKRLLKKVIDETENDKIKSTEELIQKLISELTTNSALRGHVQS